VCDREPMGTSLQSVWQRVDPGCPGALVRFACSSGAAAHCCWAVLVRRRGDRVAAHWLLPLPPRSFPVARLILEVFPGRPGPVIRGSRALPSWAWLLSRALHSRRARPSSRGIRPLRLPSDMFPCVHSRWVSPPSFGRTSPSARSRSVFAVSHRPDGLLRTRIAGLLHPAAGSEVHRVSGWPRSRGIGRSFPAMRSFPSKKTPRRQPCRVTAASCPPAVATRCRVGSRPLVVRVARSLSPRDFLGILTIRRTPAR
jgi:hypothetical protein